MGTFVLRLVASVLHAASFAARPKNAQRVRTHAVRGQFFYYIACHCTGPSSASAYKSASRKHALLFRTLQHAIAALA